MHTISLLVAEKQELQHQLHEKSLIANQHQVAKQRSQDELKDIKLNFQSLQRDNKSKVNEIASLEKVAVVVVVVVI